MSVRIQNREEFSDDVRARLDELAGGPWEYSSVDERRLPDDGVEILYVIHDAAGNEVRSVRAERSGTGEPSYRVE